MNSLCAFTPFIVNVVPLLLTIFHYLPPRLHIYRQYMHILAYRRHSVEFASFFVCARNFLIHFVVFISQLCTVCRANKQINQINVKKISIHIHTHTWRRKSLPLSLERDCRVLSNSQCWWRWGGSDGGRSVHLLVSA